MATASVRNVATAALLLAALMSTQPRLIASTQSHDKKSDKKKTEPFAIKQITVGFGLYAIGPLSPDGNSVLLIGKKPDLAPNLYLLNVADFGIRAPLTELKWGVADPQWSPDGLAVAFAGFDETGGFSEVYSLVLKTARLQRLTHNSFTDNQPVFLPDGKRILFTSDESPLPDAAFGILHIASVTVAGGKPAYFTEDETSSIRPGIAPDGKGVLLVKVEEGGGRHSLWLYGFDCKPVRDITGSRFARIHGYIANGEEGIIVLWAQERTEQQENLYILDYKTGEVGELPDPEMPKFRPAVSPDGKRIAFIGPADNIPELYLYEPATGEMKQLTIKGRSGNQPVFITNDKILFGSDREKETNELFLVDLSIPSTEKEKDKHKEEKKP
jgi:Tol biopolymer transport system component